MARQKMTNEGMLRLTVDKRFRFSTKLNSNWDRIESQPFLCEHAVLEMKYLHLPAIAKQLIEKFGLVAAPSSKFRTAIRASEFATDVQRFEKEVEDEGETETTEPSPINSMAVMVA
jgi:hypothetical protein